MLIGTGKTNWLVIVTISAVTTLLGWSLLGYINDTGDTAINFANSGNVIRRVNSSAATAPAQAPDSSSGMPQ